MTDLGSQTSWTTVAVNPVVNAPQVEPASWGVPAGWIVLDPATLGAPAVVAAVLEPDRGDELFRANAVLTGLDQGDLSFEDWQNQTDEEIPTALDDYLLIDLEKLAVVGHPGRRRLAHYLTADADPVVMEQWSVITAGIGWTLTWTIDTPRYHQIAPLARYSVSMLQLPSGGRR